MAECHRKNLSGCTHIMRVESKAVIKRAIESVHTLLLWVAKVMWEILANIMTWMSCRSSNM